jgi:histidinol dehydrogenase
VRRLYGAGEARRFFARRSASAKTNDLPPAVRERTKAAFGRDMTAGEVAARVIEEVRAGGDAAVRRISTALDGAPLKAIEVPSEVIDRAAGEVGPDTMAALHQAAARVRSFQEKAMAKSWHDAEAGYGETVTPIGRVGAYVPGGTAPLASTVVMTVVPARVAGVAEIILCSPAPGDLWPHPAVLAAARVAGVDRVFKIGGAQAIAAMAIGTETVPKVDLLCGPGNVFVTSAKRLLYGEVGIDGVFGPTETLVIADDTADPELCAADLLAQAEHDSMAAPVLVTTSPSLADEVDRELERQLADLPRKSLAGAAVRENGATVMVASIEEAFQVANDFAPEHMCVMVKDAERYASLARHAGGLFLGEYSAEVMGDYVAGPSHVMPTAGTARFASALSVRTFLRVTPVLRMSEENFLETGKHAARLAHVEGLQGHARAAEIRLRRLLGE